MMYLLVALGFAVAGGIVGYAWRAFTEPVFVCLHPDCRQTAEPTIGYCTRHLFTLTYTETAIELGAKLIQGKDDPS